MSTKQPLRRGRRRGGPHAQGTARAHHEGHVAAGDWMVYSGTYGGVLASWSTLDGSARYIRPTVVERPFPVPVRRGAATLVAPEDRIAASFGLHVDGDRVFVLAYADGLSSSFPSTSRTDR